MSSNEQAVEQLHALLADWAEAVRSKDVARIVGFYAQEVVAYDAILRLQFVGREAYGAHWAYCMEVCQGSSIFDPQHVTIRACGDVGFAHFLCLCGGTNAEGVEQRSWMRVTCGYQRIGGQWRIVHDHFSAPFDMESGQALFDLEP
ncbi:YybH family protein [Pseudomonas tohonis]|uniref:YybH family protein n=1 Tax=Pseudomonas tohonis TaxID=2725477 RepID=UPI0022F0BFF2|nr:nuclear transport factor 2 family protein [Pseudomonas tohonis]